MTEVRDTVYLVSCVAGKRERATVASDLYTSEWFKKARAFVSASGAPWFILSAEHGLVSPDTVVAPYEKTLHRLDIAGRRRWAARVLEELESLGAVKRFVVLAGRRYREFLVEPLQASGACVEVPLEGLGIGEQLQWFLMNTDRRLDDVKRFYELLDELAERVGGTQTLADVHGRLGWPSRGVYFFFEECEQRSDSGAGMRVVRVGTHALNAGSKTTLWKRLSQHRGTVKNMAGNHRGSIMRLLVGEALIGRDSLECPTWNIRKLTPGAGPQPAEIRQREKSIEVHVSRAIRKMPFLWVNVPDEPGPDSLRGLIERNAIALLSNQGKPALDPPAATWLGHHSGRAKVRASGLWNQNHVDEDYDESFLDILESSVQSTGPLDIG